MKKQFRYLFVIVIAVIMLLLCSCQFGFKKIPKIPSMNFTVNAQVTYKTYDVMSCKITSVEDGPLNIEVTKPVLMSGFSLVCQGDCCTIKYGALSYEADTEKYPQLAFGNIINQSVASSKEETDFTHNDDGTWSLHTKANDTDVWITLDGETFYPISLKAPSEELEITFTDFTPTDETK